MTDKEKIVLLLEQMVKELKREIQNKEAILKNLISECEEIEE